MVAKTTWSWGRMYDILSEGRKIKSRRQLCEKKAEREENSERNQTNLEMKIEGAPAK